jgi:hypothetical protein
MSLKFYKIDTLNMYKIESASKSDKWCLSSWPKNDVYCTKVCTLYIQKEQIDGHKMTIARGDLRDVLLKLGLLV